MLTQGVTYSSSGDEAYSLLSNAGGILDIWLSHLHGHLHQHLLHIESWPSKQHSFYLFTDI